MTEQKDINRFDYVKTIFTNVCNELSDLFFEWIVYIRILFKPGILIPLLISLILIYLAVFVFKDKERDQWTVLILNIISTLLAGVVGGVFLDTLKTRMGNSILIKKGLSAVRSLNLSKRKVENILSRVDDNASNEEIHNLLSLIGKDISNSRRDWTDIIPGVINLIEEEEKTETEIEDLQKINKDLTERLKNESNTKEIENLNKEKDELRKKLASLTSELIALRNTTSHATSGYSGVSASIPAYIPRSGSSGSAGISVGGRHYTIPALSPSYYKLCKDCGKEFVVQNADDELCPMCKNK